MPVIHQIFIAPVAAAPMQSLKTVMVTTHGLAGDRYAVRKGSSSGQPRELRDVTLISLDDIQESNSALEVPFTPAEIRRNIVIAGKISLLDFVGRELTIGTFGCAASKKRRPAGVRKGWPKSRVSGKPSNVGQAFGPRFFKQVRSPSGMKSD